MVVRIIAPHPRCLLWDSAGVVQLKILRRRDFSGLSSRPGATTRVLISERGKQKSASQ